MERPLDVIAHIHSDFPAKFGIPRQSGLVDSLTARVVFTPAYRDPAALRGLEEFSHIWLIWKFSQAEKEDGEPWRPTVRPPRLGGNRRLGVFATRSPFRPNPIGLSSVRLLEIRTDPELGPTLTVAGADLMDGTPLYDIKPYLPYTDAHPDAAGGFTSASPWEGLETEIPEELLTKVPPDKREALLGVLAQDPRPPYHADPQRIYGMTFAGREILFKVENSTLRVIDIQ